MLEPSMKVFYIIQSALVNAINWQISILDSCAHMLEDPMAKRALDTALAYADYYEKRYKIKCPYRDELNTWKEKAEAARKVKKKNQ